MSSVAPVQSPQAAAPVPPYPAALSITGSPWRSSFAHGDYVPIVLPELHIGSLGANDVVLDDPGASRLHAVIRWTPDGYSIQDLGSTSGTFVDGQAAAPTIALQPGQHIRIGQTDLFFHGVEVQEGATAAPVAPPARSAAAQVASVPAVAALPPQTISHATDMAQHSHLSLWLGQQRSKNYWRVFAAGLVAYIGSAVLLSSSDNLTLLPLVALLGAGLVPVTFVIFCWEEGAFVDMPPLVVGLAFISGATLGLVSGAFFEGLFLAGQGLVLYLLVGVCEETAKVLAVVWFLRNKQLRSELDGLVLGAAAGMGFAALETAGYGVKFFFNGFLAAAQQGGAIPPAVHFGISTMLTTLDHRMLLAVFGHGVWTAIICAALWRERGPQTLRITSGVVLAYAISVGLHGLWDTLAEFTVALLVIGVIGLLVLNSLAAEAIDRAKLGPDAPPPPPLQTTLWTYFRRMFERTAALGATLGSYTAGAAAAQVVPRVAPAPGGPVFAVGASAAAPVAGSIVGQFCPACGAGLPASAMFCPSCGQKAPGAAAPVT